MIIRPQPKQAEFLSSSADVVIFGGAAGGGKTYALLLEPLRHIKNPRFTAVILRRTYPQILAEGGMLDESTQIYPSLRAVHNQVRSEWQFPSGATVRFGHLQYENNVYDYDGAQIPLIEFDQLEQFTRRQFFYLFKANRTVIGIRPYIRAACNPDPDSFLRTFLNWWIDDDGWPIPERSGQIRHFQLIDDEPVWFDEPQELTRSCTFIHSSLDDNPILLEKNPEYKASLEALPYADRLRLKEGNWNVRAAAGEFFKRAWFEIIPSAPAGLLKVVRYWDRAATKPSPQNPDPDYTVGLKMGRDEKGYHYILDVQRDRCSPEGVERLIKNTASQDGALVEIGLEQDPGQAGKMEAAYLARQLNGYRVKIISKRHDKVTAAKPSSSQAEAGNMKIVRGGWNDVLIKELEYFPEGGHDDQVDAMSGAFGMLLKGTSWRPLRGTEKEMTEEEKRQTAENMFYPA
ncbi:MAG: phage terminase large subunit [Thermodesulfobacteriota bacterium]